MKMMMVATSPRLLECLSAVFGSPQASLVLRLHSGCLSPEVAFSDSIILRISVYTTQPLMHSQTGTDRKKKGVERRNMMEGKRNAREHIMVLISNVSRWLILLSERVSVEKWWIVGKKMRRAACCQKKSL